MSATISVSTVKAAEKLIKNFRLRELKGGINAKQQPTVQNPFIPTQNAQTGRWSPPKYSLRRQAELVKKAKILDTLHLLPPGLKTPPSVLAALAEKKAAETAAITSETVTETPQKWARNISWTGDFKEKVVKGADYGARLYAGKKRMFKGHMWERVQAQRLMKRVILMRDMKKRVMKYKGHYQRKKPNPLSAARPSAKAPKLPF